MRLLNAISRKFKNFPDDSKFPPYVILSHTWDEKQEVTLQDFASPYHTEKQGHEKITNTCRLALELEFEWVWIDTCCIDKANNTELTESINSMFRWYQLAQVCIVHLADFTKTPLSADAPPVSSDLSNGLLTPQDSDRMKTCAWFHRGWTLQELLAPANVEFYDNQWSHIGSKDRLCPLISHITRIPAEAIRGQTDLQQYSTAQRMAWASSRKTTKIEDAAYSLLGLFDVNMPLIYGEGHKAFSRLQEEILKISTDFTLLGWMPSDGDCDTSTEKTDTTGTCMPLLAMAPRQFGKCYDLEAFRNEECEYSITNRGLRLTAYLVLIPLTGSVIPSTSVRGGRPSPDVLPHRSVTVPQHAHAHGQPVAGLGIGGADSGYGHSVSANNLSSMASSGSLRHKPSSHQHQQHARPTRYQYVLTIGKRRVPRSDPTRPNETEEIGIRLRKTGPGQLIRESNQELEKMSQIDLRTVLNTTESHTFYITLRPSNTGNTAKRPQTLSSYSSLYHGNGHSQTPALRGRTPPVPQDARFDNRRDSRLDLAAKPPQPTLNVATQHPFGTPGGSILDPTDYRNSPVSGVFSPMSPPSNGSPFPQPPSPSTLRFSDMRSDHPLRVFYHPRLLRGIYVPSLKDRNIIFGNFPQQPFDERLRIYCLPESASEVVSFPCMSKQGGKDELTFSVLIDFRQGRSHPVCKVVDRSSMQSRFFFALSMRSQSEPMRWYMFDHDLPEVAKSTNVLRMTAGGSSGGGAPLHPRTYEIVATADVKPVPIDNYLLMMPTLDITITNVSPAQQ